MARQYFVLGIGGTGMRCIEALIHLCAMGMFDDTEIHLLALDTDKNNGNFARLKELKDAYLEAKGMDVASRTTLNDTFFSANIKYYEFSPNYEKKSTFNDVFDYTTTQYNNRDKTDLADLMLTESVESFNLRHGYRAQTHLGSMMMYHSIIEAVQSKAGSDIKRFISELTKASQNGTPRVFILGSVFGGTGASSIPIIPQAIAKAAEIMSDGAANVLQSVYFGSTLLTAYFSFRQPEVGELQKQKVIASSDKFALNSQVAMMFYDDDTTVKQIYQRFYMIGTDNIAWNPMERNGDAIQGIITGGGQQTNDSHYIELLAAAAALDFYNADESKLIEDKKLMNTEYLYRAVSDDGRLSFSDFVGTDREREFCQKFGMLIVFALYCNGDDNFVESVRSGNQKEIQEFKDIDVNQVEALKKYFRLFFVRKTDGGDIKEGWLRQVHRSAGGGDKFLFNAALFTPTSYRELMRMDWNDSLYRDDGTGKDNKFKPGLFGSKFNSFKKEFINERDGNKSWQSITNKGEQLYKLVFDTLAKLYKFK